MYEHDPAVARRLLVMAHWRKTPQEMRDIPSHELEMMEFSFLLLERRQSETLDNLIGGMLGTSWDASALLGSNAKDSAEAKKNKFTWSLRDKPAKVNLPLTLALTQNPKFMQHLKKLASGAVNSSRKDQSVMDVPTWISKKEEVVDLSYVSIEEFKKFAGRFV